MEQAQKHFQKVLEMEAPEDLRRLARNGLREIAARELKARGPRMDAVFYLLDALRLFRGKSLEEIREIAFEIGMRGKYGLDINDPKSSHALWLLARSLARDAAYSMHLWKTCRVPQWNLVVQAGQTGQSVY